VLPGLNDSQVPEVLERAAEAGATSAFLILGRFSRDVRPVFEQRLREAFPERADKVLSGRNNLTGNLLVPIVVPGTSLGDNLCTQAITGATVKC